MFLSSGTKLGPYKIVTPLGVGGMGVVYQARDQRLNRDVAIKVLPERFVVSEDARKRFEQEARSVAALSHPNILAVYDVGTRGTSTYVVFELLEGETLRERMRQASLPWRKVVEIAGGIADGLAAAHARGIIHRDIKPENLFITTDGVVKILDFGLARSEGAAPETPIPAESPTMTATTTPGAVMGTIGYMSPEQLRGKPVDARSDIFSFGCVLYEMLTASRAFVRETAADTMTAILKEEPPDASTVSTEIPVELSRVLTRCLEKKADERFHSARDLAFTLRSILGDSGGGWVGPKKTRVGGRRAVLGVGAIVLVIAAGLLWRLADSLRASSGLTIDSIAVLPFVNETRDPAMDYLGDGIAESIINRLRSALPELRVSPRPTAFQFRGPDVDLDEVANALNVRAVVTGRVTQQGERLVVRPELTDVTGGKHLWGDRFDRNKADILAVEETIATEIAEALLPELTGQQRIRIAESDTQNAEAHLAYLEGRFWWHKQTPDSDRRALEFFKKAIEADAGFAKAYAGVADVYMAMVSWGGIRPSEARPKVEAAVQKALELDDSLAEAHSARAELERTFTWNWAAAERYYLRAIELNPDYAFAQHSYAHLLALLGRDDEATAKFEHAARLEPLSPHHNQCLGSHYVLVERYDDAVRVLEQALEWEPSFAPAHYYLAWVHERQGNLDKAIERLETGVRLSDRRAAFVAFLAYCTAVSGDRERARNLLDELLERRATEVVASLGIGMVHVGLGDMDEAMDWLETALETRDSTWLPAAQIDAGFDRLRGQPRFTALIKRLGLEPREPIRTRRPGSS